MDDSFDRHQFKNFIQKYKSKKLIFKFGAKWCNPCKVIKPFIEKELSNLKSSNVLYYDLDVDEVKDLSSYLKIRTLPTLLSFHDGYQQHVLSSSKEDDVKQFFQKVDKM